MKHIEVEKDDLGAIIKDDSGKAMYKRIIFAYCDQTALKSEIHLIGTAFQQGQKPQDFVKVITGFHKDGKTDDTKRIAALISKLKKEEE